MNTSINTETGSIFIVDDDPLSLKTLYGYLIQGGYKVFAYQSAQQAIEQIRFLAPEMILLDVNMDEMDGFEACRLIKSDPENADIPIIFVTGARETREIVKGFEVGAVDYITKPIRHQELLARVNTHLTINRLKKRVQESEEQFRNMSATAQDAIITIDHEGHIIFWNQAAERIFRLKAEDVVGQPLQNVIIPEEFAPIFEKGFDNFLLTGQGQMIGRTVELIVKRKDGSVFPAEVSLSSTKIRGRITATAILRDISERKRMQEQLLTSRKMADLGTLAAGIAHEINSPLQVVTGVSQSLLEKAQKKELDPESLPRRLEMIYRNAWRCSEIINALRTYVYAPTQDFIESDINLIIRDTLALIHNQLVNWSNIKVSTELTENLPNWYCARSLISQAIINLLNNSRDAMPAGGEITIITNYKPEEKTLNLIVKDTGMGIPGAIKDKIFDPFFTTKPVGEGSGLGLSTVLGIVRAHSGEIEVQSQENKGTTIIISFPLEQKNEPPPDFSQSGRYSDTGRFPGIKI
jgi:PAS domain S-box-containing protein